MRLSFVFCCIVEKFKFGSFIILMLFYVCMVISLMLWCDVLLNVIVVVSFEIGELLIFISMGVCCGLGIIVLLLWMIVIGYLVCCIRFELIELSKFWVSVFWFELFNIIIFVLLEILIMVGIGVENMSLFFMLSF